MRAHGGLSALVFVSVSLMLSSTAAAQDRQLEDGTRVRVALRQGGRRVGSLKGLTTSELTLAAEQSGQILRVPVVDVSALEVSRGTRRNTGRGLFLGLMGGTAAGLLWATVGHPGTPHSDSFAAELIGFGIAFGAGGLVVGGAIGFASRSETWEQVPFPGSPAVRRSPGGISFSFRF